PSGSAARNGEAFVLAGSYGGLQNGGEAEGAGWWTVPILLAGFPLRKRTLSMVHSRWGLGLILVLAAGPASANPPVASYIFPAGGQRGKTVDVRVGGLFLYDKCGFEILGPGVDTAKQLRRTRTLLLEGPILPLPDSQRQEDYPQDMAGQVKI